MHQIVLIGYAGHAYSVINILNCSGHTVAGYMDDEEKSANPFSLRYLGSEKEVEKIRMHHDKSFFAAIGNNHIRQKIVKNLRAHGVRMANAQHPTSVMNGQVVEDAGVMLGINSVINALAKVHEGVICNTGCIIEHECIVHPFAHIGPGAVLAGNVTVGERTFIGANAVVKQGITIGNNVIVGAGSVIIRDVPDNTTIAGNPGKILKKNID